MNTTTPTLRTYQGLEGAYDFFNERLFGGALPPCLVTLHGKAKTYGYFAGRRFGTRDRQEVHDEIALNPRHFMERTDEQSLSTLVHEMCHLWQHHLGGRVSAGYHNREWGTKMKEVGLHPSNTGEPGGKETGKQMTHFIVEGGPFQQACAELLASGFAIPYVALWNEETARIKAASKTRFSCASCGANAWGVPELNLLCGDCRTPMRSEAGSTIIPFRPPEVDGGDDAVDPPDDTDERHLPVLLPADAELPDWVYAKERPWPPTGEQVLIVEGARRLRQTIADAMKLIAYAGSGKTSTLKLVAEEAFPGERLLYAAFNKQNALDARNSFPDEVDTRTMHSIAMRALGVRISGSGPGKLNAKTVLDALGEEGWLPRPTVFNRRPISQARWVALVLITFCQSADPEITPGHVTRVMDQYVGRAGLDLRIDEAREALAPFLLEKARAAWPKFATLSHGCPPFDVCVKMFELDTELVRRTMREYEAVLLDEAQDVNPVMRSICTKAGRRLIAVGDSFQQIYSWRGAEDALKQLPGEEFYLSQSFRFGQAIANVAWHILTTKPEAPPTLPLRGSSRESRVVYGETAPVMICRTNAGVLREAVKVAKRQEYVHVVGGIDHLAEELRSAVALFEKRMGDVKAEELRRFPDWAALREEATESDDVALLRLIEAVERGQVVRDLALIEEWHTPQEDRAAAVVTTAHKSKGREWPKVALGSDWPGLQKMLRRYETAAKTATRGGSSEGVRAALEEWHVLYVAVTRGIDTLSLPSGLLSVNEDDEDDEAA